MSAGNFGGQTFVSCADCTTATKLFAAPRSPIEHKQERRIFVSDIVCIELSDLPYPQTACGGAMRIQTRLLALLLCSTVAAWAQGNSFDKIRYNGGSVDSKVDPKDWHNQLTVAPDMITLALKDGKKLEIPPKTVTALSYGQEAHRRVGTMIALAILISPVALFGLLHKTRLHFIGIQYTLPDNKTGGILLQGDKDNYRAILVALQGVTGAPVSVAEKDREFVPVSIQTQVAKGEEENPANEKPNSATESASQDA